VSKPLIEKRDYYYNEDGMMVLTRLYLLERGFCCGKGCTNCPYHYENVPEPLRSALVEEAQQKKEDGAEL
jgi:hypothetical protein